MQESQKDIALKLLHDLQKNPQVVNQGETRNFEEFDKQRMQVISGLKQLLNRFFNGELSPEDLRYEIDCTNKSNPLWGFRGINGQMFFNMLVRYTVSKENLKKTLQEVLKCPTSLISAKEKINILISFIKTDTSAQDKRSLPRIKSSVYFLSYFWQIQEPEKYPIFYNSSEQTLIKLGFIEPNEELADYYEIFYNVMSDLLNLFIKNGVKANFWYVEHALWKYYIENKEIPEEVITEREEKEAPQESTGMIEEYSVIPVGLLDYVQLSERDDTPSIFEKKTTILFAALGFEAILKGQGKGRKLDVIAKSYGKPPYVILIDCKARSKKDFKFSSNDERAVQDYISDFIREYPRDRQSELHYLIVSSGFKDDNNEAIRRIKGLTNVDVSLIDAEALIFLLEKKLQNWEISLEKIREIFFLGKQITKDIIQDMLIGR